MASRSNRFVLGFGLLLLITEFALSYHTSSDNRAALAQGSSLRAIAAEYIPWRNDADVEVTGALGARPDPRPRKNEAAPER